MKLKAILKLFAPPIIFKVYHVVRGTKTNKRTSGWFGKFGCWSEAEKLSSGYAASGIVEKVLQSTMRVINSDAVFERDSVAFSTMEYNWPTLSILAIAALKKNGKLNVLDFGGSLGSSYFQFKRCLGTQSNFDWRIVEQPHFVDAANNSFSVEELSFHTGITGACYRWVPDIVLLSSVIPYLDNWEEILDDIVGIGAPYIVFDRTPFINDSTRITLQVVPKEIYEASYPCRFFNKIELIKKIEDKYKFVVEFESYCDPHHYIFEDGKVGTWSGLYFEMR